MAVRREIIGISNTYPEISEMAQMAVDAARHFVYNPTERNDQALIFVGLYSSTPAVNLTVGTVYMYGGKHKDDRPPFNLDYNVAHLIPYQQESYSQLTALGFFQDAYGNKIERTNEQTTVSSIERNTISLGVLGDLSEIGVQYAVGALLMVSESDRPVKLGAKLVVAHEESVGLGAAKAVADVVWENTEVTKGVARLSEIKKEAVVINSLKQALWVVQREQTVT